MTPDILFLGDSHTIALRKGAEMRELATDGLHWSGAAWHSAKFKLTEHGPAPVGAPGARDAFDDFAARMGPWVAQTTTVTTLGFHLGRLVPPFGWMDHKATKRGEDLPTDAPGVSRAFLRDYIWRHRVRHIRTAKKWAAQTKLIVVAPPVTFDRPSYGAFREEIIAQLQFAGVTVFDPAQEFPETHGILPDHLQEDDGLHGTADYGAQIIDAMARDGLLPQRAAA